MDKVEQKVIPKVTYAMIAMMLVLSLLAFGMSIMSEDTLVPYVALGAYYKMNIVAAYEYWRFLTAGFLAPDILSLFIYVFMFYHVGRICEPVFSRKQYASIVLISIIIGNIFTWVGDGNGVSMGIGAGIYGVIAAYTTHLICNRVIKHPLIIFALGKLICLSFIMWFIPGISLLNFMGGMCSGIMLSILFYKSKEVRLLKRNTLLSAIILLVSLVCFGIMQAPMTYDKTFDQQIIRFYQDTPWNMYARYLEKCYNKQYRWE